jgi:hypothetical protein
MMVKRRMQVVNEVVAGGSKILVIRQIQVVELMPGSTMRKEM